MGKRFELGFAFAFFLHYSNIPTFPLPGHSGLTLLSIRFLRRVKLKFELPPGDVYKKDQPLTLGAEIVIFIRLVVFTANSPFCPYKPAPDFFPGEKGLQWTE